MGALVLSAALLALQLGLSAPAQAQEPHVRGLRLASSPTAPAEVAVTEGQVKEVASGGVITYPSVTSCLTVTVRFRDGGFVGAHASLFQVPGELRSDEILAALKTLVGHRPVTAIEVRGATGAWHPSYFSRAIESYGDGEQVPIPDGQDLGGLARAVAQGLGQPRDAVSVEDVPDGDQVVGGRSGEGPAGDRRGTVEEQAGNRPGTYVMFRNGSKGEVYVYTPAGDGYGKDIGLGAWNFSPDNKTHTIQQSVNRSTGKITVWYDNQQVLSQNAAPGIGGIPFNGVFFSTFFGGHDTSWGPDHEEHAYFSNFAVGTSKF
ncbi:polysaccharide lyase [Streptomyces sp. H27-C3]|uniref:polysaccharide lyase n=1 Tax=Streptomyces sp. H27-C3 TaxID=3046305 RepID=UPI0024BB6AEC|nr:hypothetical protein [Streptomyces sp. H27-C3]MDJ0463988.1 hypothetical protein [Streptomyces sp. H27-C3]